MVGRGGGRFTGGLIFLFIAWMGYAMPGLTFVISQNNNTGSKDNKGEMELLGEGKRRWLVSEQGGGWGDGQTLQRVGVLERRRSQELAGSHGQAGCASQQGARQRAPGKEGDGDRGPCPLSPSVWAKTAE